VLLGAIAASGVLPFPREAFEATIRASGKGVKGSLAGFAAGFALVAGAAQADATRGAAEASELPEELQGQFPKRLHPMLAAGYARVREFQDDAYASLYIDRVARVLDAERAADPNAWHRLAATHEAARFVASWMAFDDIVRVADLKSRASRLARVRDEVRAGTGDVLRVYDHFKPGIPEVAALLPSGLARALKRWDARRIAAGREPLGWPIKLPVHTVAGLAVLRLLASLKWLRRHGDRFVAEQRGIDQWLAAVESGLRRDWALGHEIALCGRLVKGYGATNERGKESLLHMMTTLVDAQGFASDRERAAAIRAAREAALADDAGKALDAALVSHGVAPRPIKAQPIRFVRAATRKVA
jgi:indolepyruvate ferredoxin oxidoreductase beta subunit